MNSMHCPSCGANATNYKNCEFCGSLFIRYSNQGIESSNLFSENNFKGFIFRGLDDALNQNIELQKQNPGRFIVTDILQGQVVHLQVVPSSQVQDLLRGDKISQNGIAIHLPFTDDNMGSQYHNFLKLPESKLFTHSSHNGFNEYCIDFGTDATGAAYLCTKVLIEVFSISASQILEFNTSDYDSTTTESKGSNGNCFIATAAMGSYDHPVVKDLRFFRDNWLHKRNWGVEFTKWYYTHGPKAARVIKKSFILKKISFLIIVKPIHIVTKIFKY